MLTDETNNDKLSKLLLMKTANERKNAPRDLKENRKKCLTKTQTSIKM